METDAPSLDPMTATALRTMKDIVLPPPLSWFPQTWGWLAAALVIGMALAVWAAFATVRYRRNAYRREAQTLLDSIVPRLASATTRQSAIQDVGALLKRVAIKTWGREKVAKLSGREWSSFLAEHGASGDRSLLAASLEDVEYRDAHLYEQQEEEIGKLLARNARHWIEGHDV